MAKLCCTQNEFYNNQENIINLETPIKYITSTTIVDFKTGRNASLIIFCFYLESVQGCFANLSLSHRRSSVILGLLRRHSVQTRFSHQFCLLLSQTARVTHQLPNNEITQEKCSEKMKLTNIQIRKQSPQILTNQAVKGCVRWLGGGGERG